MVSPLSSQPRRTPSLSDMRPPVVRSVQPTLVPTAPPLPQAVPVLAPEPDFQQKKHPRKNGLKRGIVLLSLVLILALSYVLMQAGLSAKEQIMKQGEDGYDQLLSAVTNLKVKNYNESVQDFRRAERSFLLASQELPWFRGILVDVVSVLPGLSRAASGKHVIEAGRYFAEAGQSLVSLVESAALSKDAYAQGEKISLIALLEQAKNPLYQARLSLEKAEAELQKVVIDDLPVEKREKFLAVRTNLPVALSLLSGFEKNETLFVELLGGNGPRTYLFLLQNNHELRATGGFIGSYALVDVNDGVIRRFFVDGIFNPDGQLKENIVPPKPIQKISAGWSLHDSNWFPDFPTSAEKAIFFYEKTGGPTVDGVVTLTPTVMQKLLSVIGPITLPQYGLTVDAENFIPVIQEQVEVKYDKEHNEPKKVLVDLSAALFERVFSLQDRKTSRQLGEALIAGLNEKHMLIYMRHPDTERLIDEVGWSGRVLETGKDYLSVIHSNINGYKTDGVIDERIHHRAKIEKDGSVIDTVTITRTHNGGDTPYEWWNKVNADYLRVYVPKGSELISTKGTTWEFPEAPLDYERLGFRKDEDVVREEENTTIDKKSGVRISEDAGKTVFGAWVYVSPKESVTVEYQYRLPFRLQVDALKQGEGDSYSVLYQKQSGSVGSMLTTEVSPPEGTGVIWQTEPNLIPYERMLRREAVLTTDVFYGLVLGKEK